MNSFDFGARSIRVQVAGRTDAGLKRSENQDSFLIVDLTHAESGGLLLEPDIETGNSVAGSFELGAKGGLCLVADGMGGHAGGGVASNLAVASIHDELRKHWANDRNNSPQRFAQRLKAAVEASNRRIHEVGVTDVTFRGMGTTATAVGILEGFLYIAQVGDSRAYLVRNDTAKQITRDQSYTQQMIDAGTMTEEQAERSQHRNMILQALGTAPGVDVDLTYQEVKRGDLIIVCSDGLFKVVVRDELSEIARRTGDVALLCDELIELVTQRGAPDNVTVVAAKFDGNGLEEPDADDPVGHRVYQPGPSLI